MYKLNSRYHHSILFILLCIGIVLFLLFFYNPAHKSGVGVDSIPLPENISNLFKNETVNVSTELDVPLSSRLIIPSLNVDASVEYVGLTPLGAMDAPKGPDNVGLFKLGPRPGGKGSAVIAGHSGWKNNTPAVFDNLHKLKKGDKIFFKNRDGSITTFIVREFRSYDPKANAEEVFLSNDGLAHLNLITCEGVWDQVTKSRSERLVVFTDKE